MNWTSYILKASPEIALFAALALGHALGRLKLGRFSLGGVAGSLIVALIIGQVTGVVLPETLKAVCFSLFIYSVGFKSGPEFFSGLSAPSLKLVLSSVLQCLVALITVIALARTCHFGKGFGAGLGAGALTQTAMLGTASGAVSRLPMTPEEMANISSQMAVGFAVTYVFGTIGVIVFLRTVAPRLLNLDLKKAARELESEMAEGGVASRPGFITPFTPVVVRAFEVGHGAGCKLGLLTKQFGRASIERVLRGERILEPEPEFTLRQGDILAIAGQLNAVLAAGHRVGQEVESREALSFSMQAASVVITAKNTVGRTLNGIRSLLGTANLDGVYLSNLKRQGFALPILSGTRVRRGDVVELIGRPEQVQRVVNLVGAPETTSGQSDLAYHALAILVGILLGLCSVTVAGIPVTLGIGGGVLVAGLCFGWVHGRYPIFGALPEPAQWLLSEFGLSAFAAIVGLSAGPKAVSAIQAHGVALLLAGCCVTLLPLIIAFYFGRHLLKLHPVILLGALCGGQTVAAALNAVNEVADSSTPVLGFTITYAVSNVLLAIWGPVIVAFT